MQAVLRAGYAINLMLQSFPLQKKKKTLTVVSYFSLESVEQSDCGVPSNETCCIGEKNVCSYSNTIKVKGRERKIVLLAFRMHSKYETYAWIIAGPVLYGLGVEMGGGENSTH